MPHQTTHPADSAYFVLGLGKEYTPETWSMAALVDALTVFQKQVKTGHEKA